MTEIKFTDNQKKLTPNAILIDIIDPDTPVEEANTRLKELESLVNTFGGIVVVKTIQRKIVPNYENFIGTGKLDEIKEVIKEKKVRLVIINNLLKPRQLFNLNEKLRDLECEAWDRVDLILKIFSKHAQTTEAKLQIELASIKHMGPRIFGMGIELSRQAGAVGLRAGQGESNIEMMKRHLRTQQQNIKTKLKEYEKVRAGHRQRRRRINLKTAALVGYTNAGKSSLLNALTNKGAYVADKLFATLDTRVGKVFIPAEDRGDGQYRGGNEILISDTIGFIRDLPPDLIEAFKSTLAETIDADLILHVIDLSDPFLEYKIEIVEEILNQLGVGDKPKIYVFNKLDMVRLPENKEFKDDRDAYPSLLKAGTDTAQMLGWVEKENLEKAKKAHLTLDRDPDHLAKQYKKYSPVFISAEKKKNLDDLVQKISQKLS